MIIPAMAAALQAVIDASCSISSPDSCSDAARNILNLFDTNHDYRVTAEELRAHNLIQAVFAPDLDLFKANGRPGRDGINESLRWASASPRRTRSSTWQNVNRSDHNLQKHPNRGIAIAA